MVDITNSIKKGDKMYLIQERKRKFWEICNIGKENKIRYGKWNKGIETKVVEGISIYENQELGLDRALVLIVSKFNKGYILFKRENIDKSRVYNRFSQLISRNLEENEVEIEIYNK